MGIEIEVPCQPEAGNIVIVDLFQRAEALLAIGAPVSEPVSRLTLGLHDLRIGHACRRLRLRFSGSGESESVENQDAEDGYDNSKFRLAHAAYTFRLLPWSHPGQSNYRSAEE
jgi:hypothetical protein